MGPCFLRWGTRYILFTSRRRPVLLWHTCTVCTVHNTKHLCSLIQYICTVLTYVPVFHIQYVQHIRTYLCSTCTTYVCTCVLSVVPYWPPVGWLAQRLGNDCREDEKNGFEEKKEQNRGKIPTGLYVVWLLFEKVL